MTDDTDNIERDYEQIDSLDDIEAGDELVDIWRPSLRAVDRVEDDEVIMEDGGIADEGYVQARYVKRLNDNEDTDA